MFMERKANGSFRHLGLFGELLESRFGFLQAETFSGENQLFAGSPPDIFSRESVSEVESAVQSLFCLRCSISQWNNFGTIFLFFVLFVLNNLAEILSNEKVKQDTDKWLKRLDIPYTVGTKKSGNYVEIVFNKPNSKFKISQYAGCISHQVIDAGNGRFQSYVVWENEDAIAAVRPDLIKFLYTMRAMLAEISPELGVTDPMSGPIVKN